MATPVDVEVLLETARQARVHAYAPYSQYRVSAAILAEDGRVFVGVNVENSAYPSCLCAEHAAVANAVSAGVRKIRAIAVITEPKPGHPPGAPCGKCRQVLAEFGLEMTVFLAGPSGPAIEHSLSALLPLAFTRDDL